MFFFFNYKNKNKYQYAPRQPTTKICKEIRAIGSEIIAIGTTDGRHTEKKIKIFYELCWHRQANLTRGPGALRLCLTFCQMKPVWLYGCWQLCSGGSK